MSKNICSAAGAALALTAGPVRRGADKPVEIVVAAGAGEPPTKWRA